MNPLLEVRNTIEELKLLGLAGSLFRIYYELSLITGLKRIYNTSKNIPDVKIDLNTWRENKQTCFFPSLSKAKDALNEILRDEDTQKIIDLAERAIKGEMLCFSKWFADYGNPPNWHLNPEENISWPSDVHWSTVMQYEKDCGDVKFTWEINRFPHLYLIVRAYMLTDDNKYVKYFCSQLESWEISNPYGYGVNWHSGQELAIRILAWVYALYMMGDDDSFKEEDFERLLRLIYLHTKHIEKNIDYAFYAVHNNHLIGEALGLYMSGALFPYFPESERWREKGKGILEGDRCINQFYKDGGYCQLSFNYQRLALHYYLWALRIAEVNGDALSKELYTILDNSASFLYSFINPDDGRLPNWGANDGALLNPWTTCDYTDYRPLINSLSYITRKKRAFESGQWDEELLWYFGKEALESEVIPYELESKSFQTTGLHILRNSEDTFGVFRCGTITDRFGQADQLHVDIWWKGLNIAIDGGSYLYNDELQYHRYFTGTRSHNTVIVDNEDQMYLHRRFKWLYWTKAKLLRFDPERMIEGEHYGYEKLKGKVTHKRTVEVQKKGTYLIQDTLIQKHTQNHTYTLHWLINDFEYQILKKENKKIIIKFNTKKGDYYLGIKAGKDTDFNLLRAHEDSRHPDGWHSRYYAEKLPALSIKASHLSKEGASFTSLFADDKDMLNKFHTID